MFANALLRPLRGATRTPDTPSLLPAFLADNSRGHLVLTSRAATLALDALGVAAPIELPPLVPEDETRFLIRRAGRDADGGEAEAAARIAELLGYLPLALEQAGHF